MKYPDFSDALCREVGVEFFYPEDDVSIVPLAKKICSNCPVINECLEWGIHHETHGIWGGTVPRTLMMIRNKMGITVKQISTLDYI